MNVLKITVLALLSFYLYKHLFQENSISELISAYKLEFSYESIVLLTVVIILMCLNWSIEALKWKMITGSFQVLRLKESIKIILSGVSVGIITPQRVGEYGGRLAYVEKGHRSQATGASLVSIFSQVLATYIAGITAFVILSQEYLPISSSQYYALSFITIGIVIFFFWIYFNLYKLAFLKKLFKRSYLSRFSIAMNAIQEYSYSELKHMLFLSFARYFIFTVQYLLLLILFGVNIPFFEGILMIACIFFVQSVLPTPALGELGIRSGVAIFFFGAFSNNSLGIISAASAIWFINLVIPSLMGAYFILRMRKLKTAAL